MTDLNHLPNTVFITGKNSKTGSRVDRLLTASNVKTKALTRQSAPAFDWLQPDTWQDAMAGCDAAYVCFQPDLAIPQAEAAITEFIKQAKVAGIQHIVLLSGRGEAGAQQAEQLVINSGLRWNIVRASWFAQNFSEGFLIDGVLSNQVALPAGTVLEPFIDVDDIAEVAAACFTRHDLINQVFEITGPELLTFADCTRIIAANLQRPIDFIPLSNSDFIAGMKAQGFPAEVIWLMEELFTNVMDGRNSHTTDTVERVLGRPARRFDAYVKATAESGVWNINA